MYYVLRRTRYQYEITKFEDRSEPADTYTINSDKCFVLLGLRIANT